MRPTTDGLVAASAHTLLYSYTEPADMNRLQLDLSMSKDRFDVMQETYRNEGLSVGANHMVRIDRFAFKRI
jgi:hypothetical protein